MEGNPLPELKGFEGWRNWWLCIYTPCGRTGFGGFTHEKTDLIRDSLEPVLQKTIIRIDPLFFGGGGRYNPERLRRWLAFPFQIQFYLPRPTPSGRSAPQEMGGYHSKR